MCIQIPKQTLRILLVLSLKYLQSHKAQQRLNHKALPHLLPFLGTVDRVDGIIITCLKKGYSLWKPKAKAKPKNKCPW